MSFTLDEMRAAAEAGTVARVVVAAAQGSVPREVGASMLVGPDWMSGTIGGGALEFDSIKAARRALETGADTLEKKPLGPALGQCCGGAVSILIEVWNEERLSAISGSVVARPLPGTDSEMPLSVMRLLARARSSGAAVPAGIVDGWMVEPVTKPQREIWVWGAGHVGRAIVWVLAPLPDVAIRWADCDQARFPKPVPAGVETLVAENPADLAPLAPTHAEHLVLTFSHALDLEICHRVLSQPFRSLGLIGSLTKRARFRSRLKALGHSDGQIARMVCPIGDPALGKHPQQIALGVGAALLSAQRDAIAAKDAAG